jgi:pimeloyl-ACP methyl ester carboxylesterase
MKSPPERGRMIDIGGRRLRLVAAGPSADDARAGTPTVLLEAGAFGFSADWSVVQERLATLGIRSLAYDRAGMGRSDAGPVPRDGHSILDDLERLLNASGEDPPYILVGHSMAGLRVQLFAARHPGWVRGVVLVDASTPEATDGRIGRAYLSAFIAVSRLAAGLATLGLIKPFARMGDRIGLSGAARAEKEWAYAHGRHGRSSASEVDAWIRAAGQAKAAGRYDASIPVAVVTAGDAPESHPIKAIQIAPARDASRSYVKHVAGARHATLLGYRFAGEIVQAILWVRDQQTSPVT